jgi:hypothetical protein
LIGIAGAKASSVGRIAIVFLTTAALFIGGAARLLAEYRPKLDVRSADDLCREVAATKTEFCLVLRPFGADGMIYTVKADSIRNSQRVRGDTTTVEALVETAAASVFGVSTWALVDPQALVLPPGPHWVSSDQASWQGHVKRLIQRALVVIVVVPPNKSKTPNLEWEIRQCVANGLTGRLLFVLPGADVPGAQSSRECVRGFSKLFPLLGELPEDAVVVLPTSYDKLVRWFETDPKTSQPPSDDARKDLVLTDETYLSMIQEAFQRIQRQALGRSGFRDKYPYAKMAS